MTCETCNCRQGRDCPGSVAASRAAISGLFSAALYTLTVLGAFGIAYGLASAFGLYLVPLF